MYELHARSKSASWRWIAMGFALAAASISLASATESGASVYPAGVETVLPGLTPGPGASLFAEFDNFYQANSLVNGKGQGILPGFHLGVSAFAVKFVHNWGVHFLGGTLVSYAAVPYLYESLNLLSAKDRRPASAILTSSPLLSRTSVQHGTGGMARTSGRPAFNTTGATSSISASTISPTRHRPRSLISQNTGRK